MKASWIRVRTLWEAFWFSPESPRNLAAVRILVASHALWILLSRDPAGLSGIPGEFWAGVPESARWRFLVWEGRPGFETALQWSAVAALLGAVLGLWPRACCLVAGLLLYHLAPLETLIYPPTPWVKGFTISVLALLTLSFSQCGDAWCLGRGRPAPPEETPSGEYQWPLRLVQLFLTQVYLFAGWAKLVKTGWSWVSVESVQRYILQYVENDQVAAFGTLGPWIADRPNLCLLAAVGALVVDFGFAVVLFSKPPRPFVLPLVALWHVLILLSLNMAFLEAPLLLVFVDWEAARQRWLGVRAEEQAAATRPGSS